MGGHGPDAMNGPVERPVTAPRELRAPQHAPGAPATDWPATLDVHANLLGFDVGTRRVGVALANVRIGAGRPLAVVPARPFPWSRIAEWIDEWRPAYAVIGWPGPASTRPDATSAVDGPTDDTAETTVMRRARGLARALEDRFGLTSCFQDERLTSHAARVRRVARGRRDDGPIDAEAAAILLDDHLRGLVSAPGRNATPAHRHRLR